MYNKYSICSEYRIYCKNSVYIEFSMHREYGINIMFFCFWIIAVLCEGIQTAFVFERYFYSVGDPIILVFYI